jgi:hypothetical protein
VVDVDVEVDVEELVVLEAVVVLVAVAGALLVVVDDTSSVVEGGVAVPSSEHAAARSIAIRHSTASANCVEPSRGTGVTVESAGLPPTLRPVPRSKCTTPPSMRRTAVSEDDAVQYGSEERLPVTGVSPEPLRGDVT